jgi:hypothetical protein
MKRLVIAASCAAAAAALIACGSTQVVGEPAAATTDSAKTTAAATTTQLPSFDEMCEGLLEYVDGLKQLNPSADIDEALDAVLAESKAGPEWETTPKSERTRMEEAFEKAKTGSC